MADITKSEWQEWRELRETKEIIVRAKSFRLSYLIGIVGMPRGERDFVVDGTMGMDLIIDMLENIHKEVG